MTDHKSCIYIGCGAMYAGLRGFLGQDPGKETNQPRPIVNITPGIPPPQNSIAVMLSEPL